MTTNPQLTRAVQFALLSTVAAGGAFPAPAALAQDNELEQVVVTGSRIRRVDAETASPVFTLDKKTISESGVNTIGELVQQIPAISGAARNPSVNNDGGTGASTVELRGLGVERTLVLLNGRRMGNVDNLNNAVDINILPAAMIERVEVLKEGAGAIYGSDAIGGVVNFITRTDFEGVELGYTYGISGEDDGEGNTVYLGWGTEGEKGNVTIFAQYQQQDEISSADRDYTDTAVYFYTYVFDGGSSRTPTGRIRLPGTPGTVDPIYGCEVGSDGTLSVTRIADRPGTDAIADYRCFTGGDAYNYQPFNLVLTPQERTSIFTQGNYKFSEDLEFYGEVLHSYTTSGFQIAPLPLDARSDTILISADNVFNPFGIDFGATDRDNVFNSAQWRLEGLGNRFSKSQTTTDQFTAGLRGKLFNTSWEWDANISYGGIDQDIKTEGYLFLPLLNEALGPNFVDDDGTVVCGTPEAPIAGCIPVNPFNLESEQSVAGLDALKSGYQTTYRGWQKMAGVNLNGDVFELPAGPIQAAVGYEYSKLYGKFDADFNVQSTDEFNKVCKLSNETCTGDSQGEYDVNSLYAEFFIPVLKDFPLAYALNLTAGVRYSDYSLFGDSTDATFKVEYRPISDLLLRGSYSEVFRVPTIKDLYAAPASSSSQFNDPCVGLSNADLAANPNLALACEFVAPSDDPDFAFSQPNSQIDGLLVSNPNLKPETGDVITFGFVFEPGFLQGLSLNVDFWDYTIEDAITQLDVNTIADQCVATGNPFFCDLITRYGSPGSPDGEVFQIRQLTTNFGKLETSGIDFGIKYVLGGTSIGDFRFSVDATYTDKFDSTVVPGSPVIEVAGTFNRQYGNYADWRGIAAVGWSLEPFSALVSARYIAGIDLVDPDGAPGIQPSLPIDSKTYLDLSLAYTFRENTTIQLTADNLTDEEPPLLYQNNVLNSNTDVSTYDVIGTYYRLSLKHEF
jgi:iron complex outermembrane receptor protein